MTHLIKKTNSGYFLIETIFYISLLAILSVAIVNAIIVMTKSFKETAIFGELARAGGVMERITREIKQAKSVNTISASSLKLNTKDAAGADKTVQFTLSDTNLQFYENDALTGNLNPDDVLVDSLTFTQITTASGQAVKVTLSVHSGNDSLGRVQDFYDTAVLRGGY